MAGLNDRCVYNSRSYIAKEGSDEIYMETTVEHLLRCGKPCISFFRHTLHLRITQSRTLFCISLHSAAILLCMLRRIYPIQRKSHCKENRRNNSPCFRNISAWDWKVVLQILHTFQANKLLFSPLTYGMSCKITIY